MFGKIKKIKCFLFGHNSSLKNICICLDCGKTYYEPQFSFINQNKGVIMKPALGMKAKDIVTGIVGLIIGKSSWVTGCDTYGIKQPAKKDGTQIDIQWVDEARVEILDSESIFDKTKKRPNRNIGGPTPAPKQYPG